MPKHEPSPDALALAAEWWRVEEMKSCDEVDLGITFSIKDQWRLSVYWENGVRVYSVSGDGPTPAAAIIAAHEAWQKEQGK